MSEVTFSDFCEMKGGRVVARDGTRACVGGVAPGDGASACPAEAGLVYDFSRDACVPARPP